MLKVLITYHEDDYGGKDSAKGWRQEYLPRLRHEVAETGHKTVAERKLEFSSYSATKLQRIRLSCAGSH